MSSPLDHTIVIFLLPRTLALFRIEPATQDHHNTSPSINLCHESPIPKCVLRVHTK
ncbi:hypothetical protein RND81_03G071000 [Saponaria officinalis]|uniref:Uncharacterized protein n=1 Tax=Saponaria officinalis TaxID=3572 RepID=A0AAW1LYU3_SAPOF